MVNALAAVLTEACSGWRAAADAPVAEMNVNARAAVNASSARRLPWRMWLRRLVVILVIILTEVPSWGHARAFIAETFPRSLALSL